VSEELRILILEDQPTDAELMQCEVRKEGIAFSARRVETEADFRKQLREFRPGLILADYKLPSYDGMSALATVQEEYAEAPFILVSGTVGEEIAIDALQHGATDYVLKQRLSRLGPSVRRALREAQERRERQRAEAAVQRERRHLNEILEALPVMICLLTPDYQVPLANRRFRENFGESQGRRCFEYIFHRTEPCPECQSFTPLKTHAPHHWEWAAPNGRHLDIYDLPFTDANGSPLILEMAIDITERKRAEDRYMMESGYPELLWHVGLHLEFIKKVFSMSEEVTLKGPVIKQEILSYVTLWYTNHVPGADRKYMPYLVNKG
jgi:CheY-like chemotaxis protein